MTRGMLTNACRRSFATRHNDNGTLTFLLFSRPLANVLFVLIQKLRLQNFKIKDNLWETTNAHVIYTLRYQIKAGLKLDQSLSFKA